MFSEPQSVEVSKMPESRRADRIKSFLRAQILFNHRMTTIDCLIKNISSDGARIEVGKTISIPTEFEIYIPHKNKTHSARMVWRDANAMGIEFIATEANAIPEEAQPDTQVLRLRALEMENTELKVRIRDLSRRLEDLGQDPELSIFSAI
jgi:hypothetical protein